MYYRITQALQEASEAEASARAAEERASSANAETAEELKDTQERLRGVEVKWRLQREGARFATDRHAVVVKTYRQYRELVSYFGRDGAQTHWPFLVHTVLYCVF